MRPARGGRRVAGPRRLRTHAPVARRRPPPARDGRPELRKLADEDGRRKALDVDDTDDDELEIYFTENFSVVDYEPTPAPFKSKAPSPLPTDKPVKSGDLPTAYPTYVPTAAPINPTVEPTDCEMTFRDLDLEWEWGETVDIDLHMYALDTPTPQSAKST